MALAEPQLCHNEISTKIKCAGSFDLFLKLNQVKLDMLEIQRDDLGMKVAICGQNYYD